MVGNTDRQTEIITFYYKYINVNIGIKLLNTIFARSTVSFKIIYFYPWKTLLKH